MVKRDSAGEDETRPPKWREWLRNRLRRARSDKGQLVGEAHIPIAIDSPSAPLTLDELGALKKLYLYRLAEQLGPLYVYGLDEKQRMAQPDDQCVDLMALYQPLNTTIQVPLEKTNEEAESNVLSPGGRRTRPLALLEAAGSKRKVLVRGPCGVGKSTFLRYIAFSLAEQSPEGEHTGLTRLEPAWTRGWLFPLWIDLRDFSASSYTDGTAVGLYAYIAAELGIYPDQLCSQLIGPGGILLLLDGLEMAPDATAGLVSSLDLISSGTPGSALNHIIVTSQEYISFSEMPGEPFSDFAEITLASWSTEQMDSFARGWYAELRRKGWLDEEGARDLPGRFCVALRRDEVRALAQHPSMMTTIALLHTLCGRLPTEQGAFYHDLIDLALSLWSEGRTEKERDLRQVFDKVGLRTTIAQLTYQGYARQQHPTNLVELSESDLKTALVAVCRDGRWEAVNDLVSRMLARPSLLNECKPGVYTFFAPDIQAYVAARHLSVQPDLPRLVVQLAQEDLTLWRQVILFGLSRLPLLEDHLPATLAAIDALVEPSVPKETGTQPDDGAWRMAWLAGEALAHLCQTFDLEHASQTVETVRGRLMALLEQGMLDPWERAQSGRALDRLENGDLRMGVSMPALLWCEIPACPFWQGEDDAAHVVEMDTFWIARYPVTNTQYMSFVDVTGHTPPSHWHGNRPPAGIGNHPIVCITWQDANAYCEWRNEHLYDAPLEVRRPGRPPMPTQAPHSWRVRLPTSAEWEKVARGGTLIPAPDGTGLVDNPLPRRRYPWGDGWTLSTGETKGDETRCNVSESNIRTTTPAGMYPDGASPYDVMDVAGNVWEWCLDWTDTEERYKMRRGGAYRYTHDQARCSAYDKAHPDLAWPHVGFRPVLGPLVDE